MGCCNCGDSTCVTCSGEWSPRPIARRLELWPEMVAALEHLEQCRWFTETASLAVSQARDVLRRAKEIDND